jgi:uncharacterized protein YecA (UPF0149 family)
VEYRKEGTRLYKDMELTLANQVFELVEKLTKEAAQGSVSLAATPAAAPIINLGQMSAEQEIGRNDSCPCGSGKKYKNCGLKNTPEHQQLMAQKK